MLICLTLKLFPVQVNFLSERFFIYLLCSGVTGVCRSVAATVCDPGFMSRYGD